MQYDFDDTKDNTKYALKYSNQILYLLFISHQGDNQAAEEAAGEQVGLIILLCPTACSIFILDHMDAPYIYSL